MGARGKFAIRVCAAAMGCAFSFGASAQSFGRAFDDVQVGLERAARLPLEITWLQSQILADMWRAPALAHAMQGCTTAGSVKEGCAVSARNASRYTFDSNPAARPGPLVVSSFGSPKAPFARPRLNLSEGRRVFLVAGATIQLIDAAYPNIHIELSAPEEQPLLLGDLAAADLGRIFTLLVQPKVAAAAVERVQVASLDVSSVPAGPGKLLQHIAKVVEVECVIPDSSSFALVSVPEFAVPLPAKEQPITVASLDLGAVSGRFELPVHELAKPIPVAATGSPKPSADLAKMRAEIEAEIARENERFAQLVRGGGPKQFRFGS